VDEVRRRCLSPDFRRDTHFVALAGGKPVAYAGFHANGRISYPWCRRGHEREAGPLFQAVLEAMKARGIPRAFAACREDWAAVKAFFASQGFTQAREMINYVLDLAEMPTPAARPSTSVTPMQPADLPAVYALLPQALGVRSADEFERYLLHNPHFQMKDLFVLRGRNDGLPVALGVLIENSTYADPKAVDSNMPCFRLGAFGTEGMQVKRINGMFSYLARADRDANLYGLELIGHAAARLDSSDLATIAAQVASDVGHLQRFYKQYFRRQGSFPVFEFAL
jgi:hypothetical protein